MIIGFCSAILLGLFLEYPVHRLFHSGYFFSKRHRAHHISNNAYGWIKDFLTFYYPGVLPLLILGFLISFWFGLGWFVGGTFFILILIGAHYIQHHYPRRVFWMKYPIHYLHHNHSMKYNFGITNTLFDHIFGTYKATNDWFLKRAD